MRDVNASQDRCGGCIGNCCMQSGHPILDVTEADISRLAEGMILSEGAFIKWFVDASPPSKRDQWVGSLKMVSDAQAKGGGRCSFLDVGKNGAGRCSVYESRPQICRDFDADSCGMFVPSNRLAKGTREPV